MIALKIKKPRIQFFGRQVIKSNWKKLARHPLSRLGWIVAKNAREKIGRLVSEKTKPRVPPGAPRLRSPRKEFKLIFSVPKDLTSVIVGMVGFGIGGAVPIPGLHEHGGIKRGTVFTGERKFRTVGGRRTSKSLTRKTMIKVPARPFMGPAFEKAKPKIPQIWKGTLSK